MKIPAHVPAQINNRIIESPPDGVANGDPVRIAEAPKATVAGKGGKG